VDSERHGAQWEISVTDNGIGIEPEYAERVFVIFQRLHGRSDYPGTGIGLAMSRKVIEHHGGRIWLDTDYSPGTRIRFTLPVDGQDQ
jgi:light-regulated signal transduction histidine kinase (bacteriophytochrome)